LFRERGGVDVDAQTTDPAYRTAYLGQFVGGLAGGPWTLFLGDLCAGSQTTLNGWSLTLEYEAVPEPETCAMAVGLALGIGGAAYGCRRRRLVRQEGTPALLVESNGIKR
jgi:hypothetical protein